MRILAIHLHNLNSLVGTWQIVTPEGKPYLIEINSIPGMSGGSIVPKQVREAGMTLGELYDLIIEDTYDRDRR